ncbi:hypothetical protein O5269_26580, partial [Escherichia coli]|nr:hypothetical protein [Escherichia coli]
VEEGLALVALIGNDLSKACKGQTRTFFCEHIPSYVGRGCIIFSQLFFTKNIIYSIKVACYLIFRISPCRGLCTINI